MTLRLPSASSLDRVMACPASAVLPADERLGDNTPAEMGSAVHEFLYNLSIGMPYEGALAAVPERFRDEANAVDTDSLVPMTGASYEVTLAYNPVTRVTRLLGNNLNREYIRAGWDAENEFVGTYDLAGYLPDGTLCVRDYKTGTARTVKAAKNNWQLKMLAVALAKWNNADRIVAGIIRTKGSVRIDDADFGALDLELFAQQLEWLWREIRSQQANAVKTVTQGDHCNYCPSFNHCPAKNAIAQQVISQPQLTVQRIAELIAAGDPAVAYTRFKEANDVMWKLSEAFKRHATETPIQLPSGKVYGPVVQMERELDAKVVMKTLEAKYDYTTAIAAMKLETSQSAIEKAIGPRCPRGTRAAQMREVLAEVAAAGGVKTVETTKVMLHWPKKENEDE